MQLAGGCESCVNLIIADATGIQDVEFDPLRARRVLRVADQGLGIRRVRVDEQPERPPGSKDFGERQPFSNGVKLRVIGIDADDLKPHKGGGALNEWRIARTEPRGMRPTVNIHAENQENLYFSVMLETSHRARLRAPRPANAHRGIVNISGTTSTCNMFL